MRAQNRPSRPHRFTTAVGGLLLAVAAVLAPAPASAHDTLIDSSPAAGTSVQTVPATVTLTYSADLISGAGTTGVEVTAPDGTPVHAGEPEVAGAVVTVPLAETGPAGEYSVVWRVVSSDGHPISGEFVFEVLTGTEPTPAPTVEPTPDETAAPAPSEAPEETPDAGISDGSDAASDSFLSPGIIVAIVVGALFVIGLAFAMIRARSRRPDSGA